VFAPRCSVPFASPDVNAPPTTTRVAAVTFVSGASVSVPVAVLARIIHVGSGRRSARRSARAAPAFGGTRANRPLTPAGRHGL